METELSKRNQPLSGDSLQLFSWCSMCFRQDQKLSCTGLRQRCTSRWGDGVALIVPLQMSPPDKGRVCVCVIRVTKRAK